MGIGESADSSAEAPPENGEWVTLKREIRDLQGHSQSENTLLSTLTTAPSKQWGWSDEESRIVRVEENAITGEQRVIIEVP